MKKINLILTVILVLQLAYLGLSSQFITNDNSVPAPVSLLSMSADQVNSVKLVSAGKEFVLVKNEGKWLMESYQNLPANQSKIAKVIKELTGLKLSVVAANTKDAARRLKTDQDDFKLKVSLKSNSKTEDLFFGEVASFKKVYVSNEFDNKTYIADLETLQLKPDAGSWFSEDLLAFDLKEGDQIQVNQGKYKIANASVEPLEKPESISEELQFDNDLAKDIFNSLVKIDYQELPKFKISEEESGKYPNWNSPDLISYPQGAQLKVYGPEAGEFLVYSSVDKAYFKVSEAGLRDVVSLTPERLYKKPVSEEIENLTATEVGEDTAVEAEDIVEDLDT